MILAVAAHFRNYFRELDAASRSDLLFDLPISGAQFNR